MKSNFELRRFWATVVAPFKINNRNKILFAVYMIKKREIKRDLIMKNMNVVKSRYKIE